MSPTSVRGVWIPEELKVAYPEILSEEVIGALRALAPFDAPRKVLMEERTRRRNDRFRKGERISFLDEEAIIAGARISVRDAREGRFHGSEIPKDLQRQWIQGTGPAAKPGASVESSIRNVAYALLSGADGWMFDGEDALGQVKTMSLDNQRNLKLALHRDPVFLGVAEKVAVKMNAWAEDFFGRHIVEDVGAQLDFTTVLFRARGLHLDGDQDGQSTGCPAFRRGRPCGLPAEEAGLQSLTVFQLGHNGDE